MPETYLSKEALTTILDEYKRQRDFSLAGVTRAEGAILAIEHLIKVSYPDPAAEPAAAQEQPTVMAKKPDETEDFAAN